MKDFRFFNKSGLTLLEVMVALSIFAIAGVVALRACLISTAHIQIVNEEKNLVLLSIIKLEEFKAGITDIEREKSGIFPEPFSDYQWDIELADITITDTEYGIALTPYKMTVKTAKSQYSTITSLLKVSEAGKTNDR